MVVGVARVVAKEVKTANHREDGLNRKSPEPEVTSRGLGWEIADQLGKGIAGSGNRNSRDLKGKPRGSAGSESKVQIRQRG